MEVVIGGWVTIMEAGWPMIKALGQDLKEEDREKEDINSKIQKEVLTQKKCPMDSQK